MKVFSRIISMLLAAVMMLSLLSSLVPQAGAVSFSKAYGWYETIVAEISGITDADVTAVSFSGTMSGSLTGNDFRYLVRDSENGVRIDIPGVKPGTYTLTVTTSAGTVTKQGISVAAYDRSGFAHWNYTEGVGAYNDDGTLKKNAVVLYVTEENKETVSLTAGGITVTGIGNILNTAGKAGSNGMTGSGGKANTNQDILNKLTEEGRPLVVRIVGRVSKPQGVTAWGSKDYGGGTDDNGGLAKMIRCSNVTIEGIGYDAVVDGWGFSVSCKSGDFAKGWGRNFEFRNLSFRNVPEDCIGIQGTQSGSTLTDPVERTWVHHCSFYGPSGLPDASADQDKANGDGACDYNCGQYHTMSYCYFEDYRKTCLVGSSETSLQYHVTWHHNYWKNCKSRVPLTRHTNTHIYNNLIEGQSSACMAMHTKAYIFSEYNMFLNSTGVTDGWGEGVCKSYENVFIGCSGTGNSDLVVVNDKSQKVTSNNVYANFDTNASLSYIPTGDYALQTSAVEARQTVLACAGAMKAEPVTPEEIDPSIIPADRQPTASVKLPYSQALNSGYLPNKTAVVDNILFRVSGISADSLTLGDNNNGFDIVFRVDTDVTIKMTAARSTYQPKLYNAFGEVLLTGSGTAYNLPAGDYFIQSGFYGSGKYEPSKISELRITPYDPTAPTEPETEPTMPPVDAGDYIHNFTENEKESTFYAIAGNLSTTKGTVVYNGISMTDCLKLESSTSINFTAPLDGELRLVFHKTGHNVNAVGQTVNLDGDMTSYVVQDVGNYAYVTLPISAGAHRLAKGSGQIFLYYMAYIPEEPVHTHSYNKTVTAPTCTAQGYTTYTCACGDTYDADYTAATGHSYKNGSCVVCGAADPNYEIPEGRFKLAGANVDLGNSLTMNFYVNAGDIQGTDYYIEIVKAYADGTSVTTTVPYAQWESYYGVMWMVSLEGMAAKEMADQIAVTVYSGNGIQVSNTWTDSIRDYCVRQLNNASQSNAYTLLVDMLNYGAAAQTNFSYNTRDLANSTLTAQQKGYATQNFNLGDYSNNMVMGQNFIGSSLSLETNIVLSMFFMKPASANGLVARIRYTDHLGESKMIEIPESDFVTLGAFYGVEADTLVASDVRQLVTLEVYDGDTLVASGSDSMESYAVRQGGNINIALMKFTLSAYEYLH